jgi:hypothetical protein
MDFQSLLILSVFELCRRFAFKDIPRLASFVSEIRSAQAKQQTTHDDEDWMKSLVYRYSTDFCITLSIFLLLSAKNFTPASF